MSSNTSLYLKYRPIQLDDIVGQRHVVATLKQASLKKEFSHAYLLSGNHGCGKCIDGDSLILLENQFNRIKNIVHNDKSLSKINICVKDETGYGRSSNGYFEEDALTLKINTRDGYNIEGTPEHQIRIMDKNGEIIWKKLSDIEKGDFCAIFRTPSFNINAMEKFIEWEFGIGDYIDKHFDGNRNVEDSILCQMKKYKTPKKFDSQLARFFGYFVSEGHFLANGRCVSISNADKNVIKDIKNIVKNKFGYDAIIVNDKRNGVKNISISSIYICQLLDFLGLNEDSYSKCVPDIILESPKHVIREFLRAYFEGDGYVENNRRSIGCCSVSEKLLRQIHVLLLEFGIVSTLHSKISRVNNEKYVSWRISICSNNVDLFINNIGFIFDRKSCSSNKIQKYITGNTNIDIIPYLKEEMSGLRKLLPVKKNGRMAIGNKVVKVPRWKSTLSDGHGTNINLTYNNLIRLKNYFNFFLPYIYKENHNKIVKFINKIDHLIKVNYFFSPVASIKSGKCSVYDICKDGKDKSFIANGFINHNTSSARILASLMECENIKDGRVCGTCRACKTIHAGACSDVKELDGATNRGIDNVKTLIEAAQWSPQEFKRKVYLIDEVHQLSKEAISALLKTLEEPPSYLSFILCTTEINKILPTILSRCQRFNFTKILSKDISQRLMFIAKSENINIEEDAVNIISKMSRGSMRDAIGYLEQIGTVAANKKITAPSVQRYFGVTDRLAIFNIIKSMVDGNISLILDQINDMIMASADCKQILLEISEMFRNIMVVKAQNGNSKNIDLPDSEIQDLKSIGEALSLSQLLKLAHLFADVEKKIIFNINERWITEATLINCVSILRKQ